MKGCNSNIGHVNLTTKESRVETLSEDILLSYLGGRGLASFLLFKNFRKLKSPLDPNNIIVISAGLFVNTSMPSSGRTNISTLLNAEGTNFGDSSIGGRFSVALKSAGIDVLFITGAVETLSYILVENGKIEIIPSPSLITKDTYETDLFFKTKYPNSRTICIGPAGEAISPFANVLSEDRAAGGAAGNVWGSKKLKAVVAIQSPTINLAKNQSEFARLCKETETYLQSHPLYEEFQKYGTTALTDIHNQTGNFPVDNWKWGSHKDSTNVNHDAVYKRSRPDLKITYFEKEKFGCYNCALKGCSHIYDIEGSQTRKVEYEALNCLSFKIGKDTLEDILKLNTWCNKMGVDYIRLTGWLSAAVNSNNLVLTSSNFDRVFKKTAFHPDSTITKSRKFKKRFVEVKGKALSSFDPRANLSSALAAMTATRGGDHLRSVCTAESYYLWYLSKGYNPKEYMIKWLGIPEEIYEIWDNNKSLKPGYQGKEYLTWFSERMNGLTDSLGLCKFHGSWRFGIGFERLATLLTPLTGTEWTWKDLFKVAENGIFVERKLLELYKQKDYLPEFFFNENTESHSKLDKKETLALLQRYYKVCGYNKKGYFKQKI